MTRSEALLAALEQVGENISSVDERIDRAISILENNHYEHAAEMRAAIEAHGASVKDAGKYLSDGLIVASVLAIGGFVVNKIIDLSIQRGKSEAQIIQLVDSIYSLQERHGPMEYGFILERSYAESTTTDERRTLINGLVASGFLEDNNAEYPGKLAVNADHYESFVEICLEVYGVTQITHSLGN